MRIGEREIGPGRPTLVIAEIGVNHDGDVTRALRLVEAAANAGADAVKFQLFRADRLAGDAPLAAYQTGTGGQRELLRSLELSTAEVESVVAANRDAGRLPIATPFSPEDVDDVRRLGLPAVKIASPDCVNTLLLRACAELSVPMLVSTGAATMGEVDRLVRDIGDVDLALLHCVSSYPTPDDAAQLGWIRQLETRCPIVGYSDHTQNAVTGALAVAAGARVIEKHLTYDRAAAGPDHAASFAPAQFANYVQGIREAEQVMGGGDKSVQPCEQDVRRVSRQSLALRHGIAAGRVIGAADLTTRRPGDGLAPSVWVDVVGRRATRDLPAGTLLSWDLLAKAA
ncbi:MAG: N-acetylneuraminate synthase family protein [Planctomycetota bacterium]